MRSKRVLILALALVAGATLLAATQVWVTLQFAEGAAAVASISLAGAGLNPALSPIAVAAFIAAITLTIAGKVFRLVLAALVALLGAASVAIALVVLQSPLTSAGARIAEVTGISGQGQVEIVSGVMLTPWPFVAAAAGALLLFLGLFSLTQVSKWHTAGRKYDSADGRRVSRTRSTSASDPDRIADWDAQNDGEDPSVMRDEPL